MQSGFDYYISARVYTPPYDVSTSNIKVDVAGGTNISNSAPNLAGLALNSTDKVTINGTSSVVNVAPVNPFTSFTVTTAVPNGTTVNFTNFSRNVVGRGNVGDTTAAGLGMAADIFQPGGGTAPAYTGFGGALEEYISNGTTLQVKNDDTPGAGSVTPNNTWDMVINLMQSLGADANGNVKINLGNVPPPESIL
jgi:hypothetical protein